MEKSVVKVLDHPNFKFFFLTQDLLVQSQQLKHKSVIRNLFEVNNKPERRQWRHSGGFIANF